MVGISFAGLTTHHTNVANLILGWKGVPQTLELFFRTTKKIPTISDEDF
jgi:hypothetical protein